MGTIADKLNLLLSTKAAIKAAIIGKGQAVADTEPFSAYPAKITAIETGAALPALANPGTAADLLSGKQLIDGSGNVVEGSIVSRSSSSLTASGATVTVPAGHYASQASKSVASATQATPSITVSSAGLITASATQTAGYVSAGTKSATKQLTAQAAQTITPGTSNKTIASGRYLTGTQTIKGDANLVAGNIKSGVSIFGVAGTYEGGSAALKKTTVSSSAMEVVGDCLYFTLPSAARSASSVVASGYIKVYETGDSSSEIEVYFSGGSTTGAANLKEDCGGEMYYDTSTYKVEVYLGESFSDPVIRGAAAYIYYA